MEVIRPALRPIAAAPRRVARKIGRPRLLIVGCGDIGLRIVARLKNRFRIIAVTAHAERRAALRSAGALPVVCDLDDRPSLHRLRPFGERVIVLAPPADSVARDHRTLNLVSTLAVRAHDRTVYISTTGVYGDHRGDWIDETARLLTHERRSLRRIAAERLLRQRRRAHVLRVPGIYARDRLPLERLRNGTPALAPEDDVYTSHIHADDLARIAIAALLRGQPARVTNAVDDSALKMGAYFDLVADRYRLPRPPRLPRDELQRTVSPMMWSFMAASRRLKNRRLKHELRVALRYPTVAAALADQQ